METIKSWGSYLYQGYSYVAGEAWQLGSDAIGDLGNIYNEAVCNYDLVLFLFKIY